MTRMNAFKLDLDFYPEYNALERRWLIIGSQSQFCYFRVRTVFEATKKERMLFDMKRWYYTNPQ